MIKDFLKILKVLEKITKIEKTNFASLIMYKLILGSAKFYSLVLKHFSECWLNQITVKNECNIYFFLPIALELFQAFRSPLKERHLKT